MPTAESTGKTIRGTGTLKHWDASKGWGLIISEGRTFFAHASQFPDDCACRQLHKCEIHIGLVVEFTATLGVKHPGMFPPANEIRIKERH